MPDESEMIRVLAERVMAWRVRERTEDGHRYLEISRDGMIDAEWRPKAQFSTQHTSHIWNPRTSWADAGMLLDKMRADGWYADLQVSPPAKHTVGFYKSGAAHSGTAESGPEAITLAAYRAVTEGERVD